MRFLQRPKLAVVLRKAGCGILVALALIVLSNCRQAVKHTDEAVEWLAKKSDDATEFAAKEARTATQALSGTSDDLTGQLAKHADFSDDLKAFVRSPAELEMLRKLDLEEGAVNGKKVLKKKDIDIARADSDGLTNCRRMEKGLAPLGSDGRPINLHHIGQKSDSPLAELEDSTHKASAGILHNYEPSEVEHGAAWQKERAAHWKSRARELCG